MFGWNLVHMSVEEIPLPTYRKTKTCEKEARVSFIKFCKMEVNKDFTIIVTYNPSLVCEKYQEQKVL